MTLISFNRKFFLILVPCFFIVTLVWMSSISSYKDLHVSEDAKKWGQCGLLIRNDAGKDTSVRVKIESEGNLSEIRDVKIKTGAICYIYDYGAGPLAFSSKRLNGDSFSQVQMPIVDGGEGNPSWVAYPQPSMSFTVEHFSPVIRVSGLKKISIVKVLID